MILFHYTLKLSNLGIVINFQRVELMLNREENQTQTREIKQANYYDISHIQLFLFNPLFISSLFLQGILLNKSQPKIIGFLFLLCSIQIFTLIFAKQQLPMGNKIGFEADNQTVKIAYVQENVNHIKFIQGLKSKYLVSHIKWSNSIIFLFECSVKQFLNYHTTDNVGRLRNEYQKLLSSSELIIKTNRATINTLKVNKQLENALTDILMKKFELEHTQRIENSVSAMHILQKNYHQFFNFKNHFSITQLHNFDKTFVDERHIVKHLPQKYVLVILRNGITAYRIDKGKKIQRIEGSVIGQKTIIQILKFKYPNKSIKEHFQLGFDTGNLKKVDLMVQDIYGKNSHNLGLPGQIVASSLGKLAKMTPQQQQEIGEGDIIRSLLTSFAINVANLTALYLTKANLNDAIVLADSFHTDKFYSLVQSISASYAPNKSIYFADHAPFMGCLGTAFTNYLSD